MSYINIHEETIPDGEDVVTIALGHEPTHSFTDGEELDAASLVISLVSALDNGEALVITRDLF
ncbi:hypothetical protein [Streptomyces niveus]|uniref:hypothetical protein n=1 Tax=Streptomyces niveus TaxID=193462 RepID=UPI0036520D5B